MSYNDDDDTVLREQQENSVARVDIDDDEDVITITSQVHVPRQVETAEVPVPAEPVQPAAPVVETEPVQREVIQAEPVRQEVVETQVVQEQPVQAAPPATQSATTNDDTVRVERYAEELQAQKVAREAGEVRLEKEVVQEQQTLEVPVTREEVHVRSVTPSTNVDTSQAFQEGTIEVPVREEDVQVQKNVRVAEEVEVGKTAVQETRRVSDTVREERVNVEEVGDLEVNRRSDAPLQEDIRPKGD